MSHEKLDEFLRSNDAFVLKTETMTRLNKNRKILLGPALATEIEFKLPTEAKYCWSHQRLTASYLFGGALASGIGILDEWREIPSDTGFNTYGFDYVPGESYKFRSSVVTDNDFRNIKPVEFIPFSDEEQRRIEYFTLNKAFMDLVLAETVITGTIAINV